LLSPVDGAGFIQRAVDRRNARDVDQRPVPDVFPALHDDQDERPPRFDGVPFHGIVFENRVVEQAVFLAQEGEDDIADHDHRHGERQQDGALMQLPQPVADDARYENGQHDADHVVDDDEGGVVQQRVSDDDVEIVGAEHVLEIFEPDPRAAEQPVRGPERLERGNDAAHRNIVVDDEIDRARQHHQIQRNVRPQPFDLRPHRLYPFRT
jgi:hypothetical protein